MKSIIIALVCLTFIVSGGYSKDTVTCYSAKDYDLSFCSDIGYKINYATQKIAKAYDDKAKQQFEASNSSFSDTKNCQNSVKNYQCSLSFPQCISNKPTADTKPCKSLVDKIKNPKVCKTSPTNYAFQETSNSTCTLYPKKSSGGGLSGGATAAIVIIILALVLGVAGVLFYVLYWKKRQSYQSL